MVNIHYIKLKDIYGSLLTAKQFDVLTQYYDNDYTLSEISQNLGISRQAVHFTIKQAEELLDNYECKLKLLKKFEQIKDICKNHSVFDKIEEIIIS